MTAVDPRKAKFAKRCPRCGYDEWHVMRQHRQCAKCGWKEIAVMPVPANAFYEWNRPRQTCKMCGQVIIGILVNDPVPECCAACRQSVPISKVAREGGGDLEGPDMQDFADQVSKILPRNPNGPTAEQLKQAIREAKDEEIIRIPPQPEEAKPMFAVPQFVPSTAWASSVCEPLRPNYAPHPSDAPVFCGTTGDKEHVKDKALREPISLVGVKGDTQCTRCSRMMMTCGTGGEDYLCPTCRTIQQIDAPHVRKLPSRLIP